MKSRLMIPLAVMAFLFMIPGPSSAQSKPLVRIGVPLPQSGLFSETGRDQLRGMQLAQQEINSASSSGIKVEILLRDDECKPIDTVEKIRELVEHERVSMLVGAPCPMGSLAAVEYLRRQRVPLLTTGPVSSAAEKITRGPRYIYRLGVAIDQVQSLAKGLSDKAKIEVDAANECLITYRPFHKENSQSAACPSLGVSEANWRPFYKAYSAKFGAAPTPGSVLGYSALQIAAAAARQARSPIEGEELAKILESQSLESLMGRVKFDTGARTVGAVRVVVNPALTGSMSNEVTSNLAKVATKDSCQKCKVNGECPQGSPSDLLIYAKADVNCCTKESECPQGSLLFIR